MITAMSSSSLSAVDIVLGSNITLTCTSSGSPPDTFTWMKDGVPVTQSTDITTVTYTNTMQCSVVVIPLVMLVLVIKEHIHVL